MMRPFLQPISSFESATFLIIIVSLLVSAKESNIASESQPYAWKTPHKYYYDNIVTKIHEVLNGPGKYTFSQTADAVITAPTNPAILHVATFPAHPHLVDWWRSIPRPDQMRVDPFLCAAGASLYFEFTKL